MNEWKGLIISILRTSLTVLIVGPFADAAPVQIVEWKRQLDTGAIPFASADGVGSVYVAGGVGRSLGNAVLHRVSAAGDLVWSRYYGDSPFGTVHDVSADGLGNVYLGGYLGPLNIWNGFLAKYDEQGNFLWERFIGANKGAEINGVAADGLGNVYVAGFAREAIGSEYYGNRDGFVSKYDASGNLLWARQIGTDQLEELLDIAADGLGNVYAVGHAIGDSSLVDVLVTKFDSTGNLLWSKTFGSSLLDYGTSVDADALGNIYVAGITNGNFAGDNKGISDVFVTKLDATGDVHWSRQFGTADGEEDGGVATDGLGNVFVNSYVNFSYVNPAGPRDGSVAKFDASGNPLWTLPMNDYLSGVSSDRQGNLYVSGATVSFGNSSPFVVKIREIPEPSTITLFGCAICLAALIIRRKA